MERKKLKVKSHTRKLKNGKKVKVKGYYRKRSSLFGLGGDKFYYEVQRDGQILLRNTTRSNAEAFAQRNASQDLGRPYTVVKFPKDNPRATQITREFYYPRNSNESLQTIRESKASPEKNNILSPSEKKMVLKWYRSHKKYLEGVFTGSSYNSKTLKPSSDDKAAKRNVQQNKPLGWHDVFAIINWFEHHDELLDATKKEKKLANKIDKMA